MEHVFRREDRRFSRFRPDSELSRVNAAAGEWVQVSRAFAILTERSLRAAAETDGLFDPTVLPALAAAGYDRDWAEVEARGVAEDEELAAIRRDFAALMIKHGTACGAWREIDLDGTNLRIPEGAALDFGGIAKGWAVDRAASRLQNLPWAIVNAGVTSGSWERRRAQAWRSASRTQTTPVSRRSGWGSSRAHSRPRRSPFAPGARVTIT